MNEIFGEKKGLIGFTNLGNTCFMNSALQCLRFTLPLSGFLIVHNVKSDNDLTNEYIDLVRKSWGIEHGPYRPISFKNALGQSNQMFRGCNQHDSQEMIIHLLDTIHESLKNVGFKNKDKRSIISDVFYGKFKQKIHCPECDYVSRTYQSFIDLQVPLVFENGGKCSLEGCFKEFLKDETLDEDNKYKCEKCKNTVRAVKKMELDVLPNFLIIALKRFDKFKKLNDFVDIPLKNFKIPGKPNEYDLYATVNHYGGRGGGHYTANVLHPNGNWYHMDDSRCNKIMSNQVIDSSIYIAFFRCKN